MSGDKNRLKIASFIMFDFGNSAFTTVIVTAFYVLYFKEVVMEGAKSSDFYWGLAVTLSMLFVGISSPLMGAIADYSTSRRRFMVFFAVIAIFFTAMLSLVNRGDLFLGFLFFILANIGFEASNVFNNSFLPQISTVKNRGRISGWAWGLGYIGGILSLFLILPFVKAGFSEENLPRIKYSFYLVSLQYFLFCLPAFLLLKDFKKSFSKKSVFSYGKEGAKRVAGTLKEIKKYKDLFLLIIAFLIYNDGIHTVIVFAGAFANDTLKFSVAENIQFLIMINIVAALGAITFGHIVDRIGAKRSILITLVVWIVALIMALFVESKSTFYIIGVLVGIALGSSQSATRTLIGLFSPKRKSAEFYGFAAIGGKFSAILGPILFGFISSTTGSQKNAVSAILLFFVAGFILLLRVNEKRGIELARKEDEIS